MEVAAETNEIIAPIEITLPAARTAIDFVSNVVGQPVSDVLVVTSIEPCVRKYGFGL